MGREKEAEERGRRGEGGRGGAEASGSLQLKNAEEQQKADHGKRCTGSVKYEGCTGRRENGRSGEGSLRRASTRIDRGGSRDAISKQKVPHSRMNRLVPAVLEGQEASSAIVVRPQFDQRRRQRRADEGST